MTGAAAGAGVHGTAACTHCGGVTLPIAYGYPGPGLFAAAERGEVALGGCMVSEGQPTRRCRDCQQPVESPA